MNSSDTGVVLAYATFPDAATAERICTLLVSEDLARCANIFAPHLAIYRWDDQLKREPEVAAILKLPFSQREALARRFTEVHPYDEPALAFVDVTGGSTSFLEWIRGRA